MPNMSSAEFFLPTKKYRYLSILLAIHHADIISQHGIASEVGMSGAMINGYIKELNGKGLLRINNKNKRDKEYRLTKSGEELLMDHLMLCSAEIVQLYSSARRELVSKMKVLCNGDQQMKVLLFGGADTAHLVVSALENLSQYTIVAIVDNNKTLWGQKIGGHIIQNPELIKSVEVDCVVISSFAKQNEIYPSLKIYEKEGTKVVRLSTL